LEPPQPAQPEQVQLLQIPELVQPQYLILQFLRASKVIRVTLATLVQLVQLVPQLALQWGRLQPVLLVLTLALQTLELAQLQYLTLQFPVATPALLAQLAQLDHQIRLLFLVQRLERLEQAHP
jgi:hypothetical protein